MPVKNKQIKMKTSRYWNIVIFSIGVGLVVIGLSLGLYGPIFFKALYQEQLQLTPQSSAFKLFLHTPLPLFLEVYLFNWTNAKEFMVNKSVTPHFEEVGPFVFREVHDRVNVVWNDNNTVTYNQTRKWFFVPEMSKNLSVEVTNLNVITTTLSQMVKNYSKMKWVLNYEFNKYGQFLTTSPARNWLFDGIEDELLNTLVLIEKLLHLPVMYKKFGWFYGRNMSSSYDGIFTIKTGSDNLYDVGIMDKWNGMNKTVYFDNECGMVNGTSGELFPSMKQVQDNLTVFISDICSSITLNHGGSSIVEGIASDIYVGENITLDNGQFNPENKCFCKGECAPFGVRDVSSCRKAPLFFSFPHFYQADEYYRKSISGMMPNKDEHEFFIQLDPISGIPTNVRAQLQINTLLQPISWLKMFSDVPKLYIPMMWFRERATITPELAFKAALMKYVPYASACLFYGLVGIGILIIAIRLLVIWRTHYKTADSELLIPPVIDHDEEKLDQ